MTIALFSVPTPHHALFYKYNNNSLPSLTYPSSSKLIVPMCSPSSTSTSAIEDSPPSPDELPLPQQSQYATKLSGCKACGREEKEKGCNGEGRIQGGIATVPGFGWWPIKAYRPCPGFLASGGRYRRQGQSMDEVAFGRGGAPSPSLAKYDSSPSFQNKRRVTIQDFRGKTLVSIREYYRKDEKDLPSSKGINLTEEQWSTFEKNVPAIEKAVKKLESRDI